MVPLEAMVSLQKTPHLEEAPRERRCLSQAALTLIFVFSVILGNGKTQRQPYKQLGFPYRFTFLRMTSLSVADINRTRL